MPEELHGRVCTVTDWDRERLTREREDDASKWPPRSAGGLHSTLRDLFKLGQAMLDGGTFDGARILSRRGVAAMTTNHLDGVPAYHWGRNIRSMQYGMGLMHFGPGLTDLHAHFVSTGTFGHEGAGFSCWYIDPAEELVCVYTVPNETGWVPAPVINPRAIVWSGLE